MTDIIGKSIGRYHILEQLGEGGMATVYKAYDTRLETDVAVKIIRTENLAPNILATSLIRFEREAKALARLTHANIVKVLDYGEYENKPWLVMPYLPGGTLKEKLHGQPMNYQVAASLLIPIAHALAYAHEQGMVHRDVKPSNILITQSGDPMLTDFGIAKIIGGEVKVDLTGTSVTIGTPEYMAPEQATSKNVDNRADIYALGVVLFEMLTGRKPYQADTPMAVLFKHVSEPLPHPRDFAPGIPEAAERILFKALAKQPDDRYQNMDDFAAALEKLARGDLSSIPMTMDKKKSMIQEATVLDTTPTEMAGSIPSTHYESSKGSGGSTQYGSSSGSGSSGWKRYLPIGLGAVGIIVAGICILAAIVILMQGNNSPTTPSATGFIPYVSPTTRPIVIQPTSRPPSVDPTSPPPVIVQPTNPPESTATPSCPRAKYPTLLKPDREARICTQSERVIVRRSASMNAEEILSLYTGTTIRILEGPVCADDFWWWKIEIYPGTVFGKQGYDYSRTWVTDSTYTGWAREGWDDKDKYFICQ
jgi:serine/threonine protein kinase